MAYGIRQEIMVTTGRSEEFEATVEQLQELLKQQPGFDRTSLSNSLSYPQKYARVSRWESREAERAFNRSRALKDFIAAHPQQGIAMPSRQMEAYEIVHTVRADQLPATSAQRGRRPVAALIDIVIDNRPGNAEAFERSRLELFELRKQYGHGLITNVLHRLAGSPGHYLGFGVFASREDVLATAAAPEVSKFLEAHPASAYASAPPTVEFYEVVSSAMRLASA